MCVFFFKQKAAYGMRISDWSSDVCSSDRATLSREQALAFFGKYFATVSVRFRDIRRLLTPQGWVQQHRVNADGPDGFQIRGLPACLVFTLSGGKLPRIEANFDSARTT